MDRNSSHCRSHCPINFVLETFGAKWTLLIVRDMMFKGKWTYGQFLESDESISTNILADRLKRLEGHGIIEKGSHTDGRGRSSYALTERGKDMLPVMLEITAWSARHDGLTNAPDIFLDRSQTHRETMIETMRRQLDAD